MGSWGKFILWLKKSFSASWKSWSDKWKFSVDFIEASPKTTTESKSLDISKWVFVGFYRRNVLSGIKYCLYFKEMARTLKFVTMRRAQLEVGCDNVSHARKLHAPSVEDTVKLGCLPCTVCTNIFCYYLNNVSVARNAQITFHKLFKLSLWWHKHFMSATCHHFDKGTYTHEWTSEHICARKTNKNHNCRDTLMLPYVVQPSRTR